jgi:protein SCO1/2
MTRYTATLLALVCLNACAPATDGLPYYRTAELTPEWLSRSDAMQAHRVPDFELIDQSNQTITGADLDGHVVLASFFFTSCAQVCPILRSRLAQVQDHFLEDERVLLLSHSIVSEADSVPVLARYAASNGVVEGKWHLLTGEHDALYELARIGYFVEVDTGAGDRIGTDLIHTETVVLLDTQRRIRGVYTGTLQIELDRILEDIAALLAEQ